MEETFVVNIVAQELLDVSSLLSVPENQTAMLTVSTMLPHISCSILEDTILLIIQGHLFRSKEHSCHQ